MEFRISLRQNRNMSLTQMRCVSKRLRKNRNRQAKEVGMLLRQQSLACATEGDATTDKDLTKLWYHYFTSIHRKTSQSQYMLRKKGTFESFKPLIRNKARVCWFQELPVDGKCTASIVSLRNVAAIFEKGSARENGVLENPRSSHGASHRRQNKGVYCPKNENQHMTPHAQGGKGKECLARRVGQ